MTTKRQTATQKLRTTIREMLAKTEYEYQLHERMRGIRYIVRLTQAEYDALKVLSEEPS